MVRGPVTRRVTHKSKAVAQNENNLKLLESVAEKVKTKVETLAQREADVSNEIKQVHDLLKKSSQKKGLVKKPSKLDKGKAKRLVRDIKTISAQTRIFNERAHLLSNDNLPPEARIQLLNQMEKSVYAQESTLHRIGRLLTNPYFLIAVAALYGIAQTQPILKEAANAAATSATAAEKTFNAGKPLACLAASIAAGFLTAPLGGIGLLVPTLFCG